VEPKLIEAGSTGIPTIFKGLKDNSSVEGEKT